MAVIVMMDVSSKYDISHPTASSTGMLYSIVTNMRIW